MAVQSVVGDRGVKSLKFPKLMKHKTNNRIVLFETITRGVEVRGSNNMESAIGFTSNRWDTSDYEDFNGSVTLSNNVSRETI